MVGAWFIMFLTANCSLLFLCVFCFRNVMNRALTFNCLLLFLCMLCFRNVMSLFVLPNQWVVGLPFYYAVVVGEYGQGVFGVDKEEAVNVVVELGVVFQGELDGASVYGEGGDERVGSQLLLRFSWQEVRVVVVFKDGCTVMGTVEVGQDFVASQRIVHI